MEPCCPHPQEPETPQSSLEFGRILLLSCYELGQQPLGLAVPAGVLQAAGFKPDLLDLAVDPFSEKKIQRASLVCISVPMHTALRLGVEVAKRIRVLNPACHICFYGLYAQLNSAYLLEQVADTTSSGESYDDLLQLAESLSVPRATAVGSVSPPQDQPMTPPPPVASPRRPLPVLPRRDRLPTLDRYVKLWHHGQLMRVGYTATTTGCKHTCLHCPLTPVYKGRFYAVPKDIVHEDIQSLVRAGAEHISFGDPDFLNGPAHARAVARALHKEFPAVTFDYTAKIEHILKLGDLVRELKSLGNLFIISAVESLSNIVLKHIEKGHTRDDVFTATRFLSDNGIVLRPSLMPFTPWSTLDDYQALLDWIEGDGLIDHLDPVQLTIRLLVPPHSALLERAAIHPYILDFTPERFTYAWKHPDPRMDAFHQKVSSVVETAVTADEDPAKTFYRIRQLTDGERLGTEKIQPLLFDRVDPNRTRPPRLTESWFCCAEPTDDQFAAMALSNQSASEHPPALHEHQQSTPVSCCTNPSTKKTP